VTAGLLGGSFYPHLRSAGLALEPCKVGMDQEKFEQEKLRSEGLLQEEENRRLEIPEENCEVPQTVGSGRSSEGFNPQAQVEPICHRISAYRGWRVQEVACTSKSRVAISRFSGSRRSSEGQVARDPTESALRGFQSRRICITELSAKSRGDVVPGSLVEYRWRSLGIGTSGLGVWKGQGLLTSQVDSRYPEPLTIDHRHSGFGV
jgi:hypothetical protein